MCTNFHATKHCDDEGYDLTFMNMVNFVLMEEVEKIILKVKSTLRSDYSGSCDVEIILEGSQVDTLRINQRTMRVDEIPIPCLPLQMEISLDSVSKTPRNVEIEEEKNHQTLEE